MDSYLSSIRSGISRITEWAKAHKIISGIVIVGVAWLVYRGFAGSASAQTRYVLGTVDRGTLTVGVSGVGQISASNQVDVKPKVSDDVVSVDVVAGQTVKAGQVLARLDTSTASQAVQNARIALQNAQITLQKLQQNQAVGSSTSAQDLSKAYEDTLNSITTAFLSLPDIMSNGRVLVYGGTLNGTTVSSLFDYSTLVTDDLYAQFNTMARQAKTDYQAADSAYEPAFQAYLTLRQDATPAQISDMLTITQKATDAIAQMLVSHRNLLDTLVTNLDKQAADTNQPAAIPAGVTTSQSVVASAITQVHGFITDESSEARAIQDAQQTIESATVSDPLDIATQQNAVQQQQANLQTALTALADHTVRAPFDGVVAKVDVKKGDPAGSGTTVATVISHDQLVVVPLNEVDVAKVKLGQKATLTFDALPDLMMTGTVSQVDSIGTTSQGVVSYNVTIVLDTQNDQVRPGMSASVTIISDVRQNVLLVPSSAVKTQNGTSYVEVLDNPGAAVTGVTGVTSAAPPRQITVTTGISDDTSTEIMSGLTEGQSIIVRTITGTSTTTTTTSTTQNRTGGSIIPGAGGGGALFRATGR